MGGVFSYLKLLGKKPIFRQYVFGIRSVIKRRLAQLLKDDRDQSLQISDLLDLVHITESSSSSSFLQPIKAQYIIGA